jgi:hypothetical protein
VKKLLQFLSAALISTAMIGGFASAATCDGSITVTGPGSNNVIDCNDVTSINLTCTNNVVVGEVNTQTGTSGDGVGAGNTAAGSAISGSVVNDNGSNVTIGSGCNGSLTGAPGAGAIEQPGGGQGAAGPTALPNTDDSSAGPIVIASLASALGVVALSRIIVTAYRRLTLR